MSSSKPALKKFVVEVDFIQERKEAVQQRKEAMELARIEAAKPKITEADVTTADQAGFVRGVEEGKAQALSQLREEMQEHLAFIHHKVQRTDLIKEELALQFEKYTLQHVKSLLESIFESANQHFSDELLETAIKAAVNSIQTEAVLTIHMHAESKEYLEKMVPEYLKDWQVNLVVDPQIAQGNCLIDWATGGVDTRITQISEKLLTLIDGVISGSEHSLESFLENTQEEAAEDGVAPPVMEMQEIEVDDTGDDEEALTAENTTDEGVALDSTEEETAPEAEKQAESTEEETVEAADAEGAEGAESPAANESSVPQENTEDTAQAPAAEAVAVDTEKTVPSKPSA